MLEFLFGRMGLAAVAIEATMLEGFDVNHYAVNGRGDPTQALSGLFLGLEHAEGA